MTIAVLSAFALEVMPSSGTIWHVLAIVLAAVLLLSVAAGAGFFFEALDE